MRHLFKYCLIIGSVLLISLGAKAQNSQLVQVTGLVKLADTSDVIPYMGIYIKNSGSGTLSNEKGLFSLIAYKGDTLVFSRLGFEPREIIVPHKLDKPYFNTTQYFVQDTFMLDEFFVRAYMTADEFDYAMRYKEYDADIYKTIKENTSKEVVAMMMRNLPQGGGEGAALIQRQAAYQNTYYGQQAPVGLFNPFKWADFYKAVQRGDYRKKK